LKIEVIDPYAGINQNQVSLLSRGDRPASPFCPAAGGSAPVF
jgi:hypothetical protein